MSFYWLRNRDAQEQLIFFWDKGINKNWYYFTKHHPPAHHRRMRPVFILKFHIVRKLKKCIDSKFQNSDFERVYSWADSIPRPFRTFRPFRVDSGPSPFIPGRLLSGITSIDYLTSRGKTLMDSLFRPVANNSCRPCTSQVRMLMDCTSRTLTNISYNPLTDISSRPYTWWWQTVHSYKVAILAPFLISQVWT